MKHYLYCSSGNTEGLYEPVGGPLKYTEEKPADEFGALPEGPWDALEAARPEYGTLNDISKELFDSAWNSILAR